MALDRKPARVVEGAGSYAAQRGIDFERPADRRAALRAELHAQPAAALVGRRWQNVQWQTAVRCGRPFTL
jgi:hypothetical protein